ncbi:MAG: ParB/RepB/Spo0J family partition protein [Oscillospiraceae bacterium]|jgi:ParB family chromosome partitioning protein|nr:ParB/RepB/Spo0J family partition protein [Oscillospiraceae bacterium]MDE6997807.1 ParB/RepB/Spo0J family partition protein [Oscillospiraceae bacterium]
MLTPKNDLYQSNRIHMLPIERISPNPRQPRRHFPEQPLRELADSIRQHGVLQPLSVQKTPDGYVLVAGERRLRAAGMAGLTHVPCILVRASPQDSALLALVENLQRSDLHYLEEAAAISKLITTFGMSQEEAARRLGRSQPAVANKLRLLRLSPACGDQLRRYGLTERHARALLRLEGEDAQLAALRHIGEKSLNVAAAEEYIESLLQKRQRDARAQKRLYIIKDVRLFLNSVDRGMETIRRAGVDARCERQESDEAITLTIQIPKAQAAKST